LLKFIVEILIGLTITINFWRYQHKGPALKGKDPYDGRWRWQLFDLDHGFGIWGHDAYHNTLDWALRTSGDSQSDPGWSTIIFRRLLENEQFKNQFIQRYSDLLNSTFRSSRVNSIIDSIKFMLEPEIDRHMRRWPGRIGGIYSWNANIDAMKTFATQRPSEVRKHLRSRFNLGERYEITVDVSDSAQGWIQVNTLKICPSFSGIPSKPYPWKGDYFQNIPLTLKAIPKAGFTFSHWDGDLQGTEIEMLLEKPTSDLSITAVFRSINSTELIAAWDFERNRDSDTTFAMPADYETSKGARLFLGGEGTGKIQVREGHLRVRNPVASRELVLILPTSGYKDVSLEYQSARSKNGALKQQVFYRTTWEGPLDCLG
jgi:hypothetical protein